MGTAFGSNRYDAVNLNANLTPKTAPTPAEVWPIQMVDYTRKGPGAGVQVQARPQPWRLTTDMTPSAPKPGRLRPF